MSARGLAVFDETVHITHVWLNDLMERLDWSHKGDAYRALRVTLHALRDRLPVNTAVALAAQLPMLVRGFYFENWRPAATPTRDRTEDDFVGHIAGAFDRSPDVDPSDVARAVFELLEDRISEGEITTVKSCLPQDIRDMWE